MFLQHIFSLLLQQKTCEQTQISNHLFTYFRQICILDATVFQVSNALENVYSGSGGYVQTAGIKIQLEYYLHGGKFLNFQVRPGKNNDKTFGTECLDTLRSGDLCIRDLVYFSLEGLNQMDQRGVCYIPTLKLKHIVYTKNLFRKYIRNGTIKKQSQYIQVDLENIIHMLKSGKTYEIKEAYIGKYQRLFTRVIIYRLTEEQINDFYSLRWKIKIIFKTWKSLFQIHHWQTIKLSNKSD